MGRKSIYKILVKRGFNAIKCLLYKRFSASHEDLMSSWKDLVFFEVWRDAKIGIIKSVPENIYLKTCTTRFPGAQSASLHLNSLRACWRSTAAVARVSISAEADGKCLCCSGAGNTLGKWHFVVVKMTFPDVWKFRILKLCPFKLSDESLFRRYWNINY